MKKNLLKRMKTQSSLFKFDLKMKLTTLLLLTSIFVLQANESYSQRAKISLDLSNITVEQLIDEIENKTEFRFMYLIEDVDLKRIVSFKANNEKVNSILDRVFSGTKTTYKIDDRQISLVKHLIKPEIKEKESLQQSIQGKVNDKNGQPLPGANILIKGTRNGTQTDFDGNFSLEIANEKAVLVVSYLGFKTKEILVGKRTNIVITLEDDASSLDEVVVVGYGTVRKGDLTGSVGSIKATEITKQSTPRIDQALQGRIAGVQVSTTSGAPGSGSSIRIRGGNSINAGNEPLFVIDGFIGGGDLNTINPNDVESIEVLKDASATAIYGSRGSNGVILVTTKRGSDTEGFGVTIDSYGGIQTPIRKIDMLNGPEFADYRNEFAEFVGNVQPYSNLNEIANTDWQDVLFRDAPMTSHTLSIYNNTKTSNYYASLNYLSQDGIQLGSGYERYQLRFNFDQKLGKVFKIGASMNISYSERENPRASALIGKVLPTAPIYLDDGSFDRVDVINGSTYNNPIAQDKLISNDTYSSRNLGNIYLQFNPIEGLVVKTTLGFDFNTSKQNIYQSANLPENFEAEIGGQATVNTSFSKSIQNENTVNYTKDFENHSFNILGGWTYQKFSRENLDVDARGFNNDVTTFNAIETGDPELLSATSGEEEWALLSGLYRLNYSFKNRYLLTLSGRHDGSSRLAEGNNWQFFPAAAIAWRMSEENFIKELDAVSNLKLRASYGQTGSQSINPYATIARLNSGTNYLGDQQVVTFLPASSADPNLKWEVTDQYDIGLEAGFLNNRFHFEVDYYYKKTTDLLLSRELPFQTGFGTRLENVGSLENKGIDITIGGTVINRENFSWSSDITVSSNKNKILSLSEGKGFLLNGTGSRLIVGESVNTFFGAKFLGLWQEGDPGLGGINVPGAMKFEDLNDDGEITELDGQIIGEGIPDFYGGFNNIISYKNFTLTAFFDFSYGNDIYDLDGRIFNTGHSSNVYGKFRDRWTPENTNTNVPRAGAQFAHYFSSSPAKEGNSYDVYDGSYLRLKTLNLNYLIPMENKIFKKLALYATATNLFTITNYEGFSPDVNSEGTNSTRRGFDSNDFPPAKILTIGIKADF